MHGQKAGTLETVGLATAAQNPRVRGGYRRGRHFLPPLQIGRLHVRRPQQYQPRSAIGLGPTLASIEGSRRPEAARDRDQRCQRPIYIQSGSWPTRRTSTRHVRMVSALVQPGSQIDVGPAPLLPATRTTTPPAIRCGTTPAAYKSTTQNTSLPLPDKLMTGLPTFSIRDHRQGHLRAGR